MASPSHSRISPTAHYTAYLWYANGLSSPALATPTGRLLHGVMEGVGFIAKHTSAKVQFKESLLCRHLLIDHLLGEAIEAGEVGQVIEMAAGLSGRGLRFMERYGDKGLTWIDADLPGMAEAKKARISAGGEIPPGYSFQAVDLMAERGPLSMGEALGDALRPGVGVAVITEGLIPYFPKEANAGMWRRIGALLAGQPQGRYYGSIWLGDDLPKDAHFKGFSGALQLFVRGRMYVDFRGDAEVRAAFEGGALSLHALHRPDDFRAQIKLPGDGGRVAVRILEART